MNHLHAQGWAQAQRRRQAEVYSTRTKGRLELAGVILVILAAIVAWIWLGLLPLARWLIGLAYKGLV